MRPLIIAILISISFATKACGEEEIPVEIKKKIESKEKKSPLETGVCVGLFSLFIYLIVDKWTEDNLRSSNEINEINEAL